MLLIELIGIIILVIIIAIALGVVIYSIFLRLALSLFKCKNKDIRHVISTAFLCATVGLIPGIGCIMQWFFIDSRHETGFGMAIIVWCLSICIGFAIIIFTIVAIIYFVYGIPLI